jgi:hypothetical protein
MSNLPYFTLQTDTPGSTPLKFGVLLQGYEQIIEKKQNVQETIDGGLDVSYGGIYEQHTYVIRIREQENRPGYGSKADLEALYRLNNPNAVPSPLFVLVDHFEKAHNVIMVGSFAPSPVGIMITGDQSWQTVKCIFKFIPETEGSGSGS